MPDATPMCNKRVGDRTITYSCYLPQDHDGPCAAHEDARSLRVRQKWQEAQADLAVSQGAAQTFWENRGEPGGGTAPPGQDRPSLDTVGDVEVVPQPDFVRGVPVRDEGWGEGEESVPPFDPAPNRANVPELSSVQMVEDVTCPVCGSTSIDPMIFTGQEPGGGNEVSFRRCATCGGFFSPPVVVQMVQPVKETLQQIRDDLDASSLAANLYVRRLDEVLERM